MFPNLPWTIAILLDRASHVCPNYFEDPSLSGPEGQRTSEDCTNPSGFLQKLHIFWGKISHVPPLCLQFTDTWLEQPCQWLGLNKQIEENMGLILNVV